MGRPQFIFEMNEIFMSTLEVDSVYIPYNINENDLYVLLSKVNGIFFTGGSVDLYDEVSKELHPYTITS